jgi:Pentapeptide repeats (8 copies)
MSAFRSAVIFGCSLLGASAIAVAVPATSNAACLLGIKSLVCNNGVLSSPGSTGIINTGPGSTGILNLGPFNTGIGNIGAGNTGLLNIGAGNVGAVNVGVLHHGLLGCC